MKIADYVAKPTVKKITIDDPEFVEQFGDTLDFHVMLPLPIGDYATLSKLTTAEFVEKMLVDENGNRMLVEGKSLAPALLTPVSIRIWAELGKLPEKS